VYSPVMPFPGANTADRSHGRVYAGLVLTMVFWGSAFATSKMLVLEVPPEVGAVLRFGLGSLLMMAILFRRSAKPVPARADWGRLVLVSLVGVTGFNTLFFRGLSLAPASDAGMIIPTMSPVFTAMAGMLFLGEGVRFGRVAGLAVSLAGAVLFFGDVLLHTAGQGGRVWGDAALVGAAMCWAATSILSRPLSMRIGAMPTASWTIFLGSVVLLLVSSPKLADVPWGQLTGRFWIVLAYVVVFPTVIAYILWMEGIRTIGSGPTTSFMFLAPVFALLIAAALLGERGDAQRRGGGGEQCALATDVPQRPVDVLLGVRLLGDGLDQHGRLRQHHEVRRDLGRGVGAVEAGPGALGGFLAARPDRGAAARGRHACRDAACDRARSDHADALRKAFLVLARRRLTHQSIE